MVRGQRFKRRGKAAAAKQAAAKTARKKEKEETENEVDFNNYGSVTKQFMKRRSPFPMKLSKKEIAEDMALILATIPRHARAVSSKYMKKQTDEVPRKDYSTDNSDPWQQQGNVPRSGSSQ